MKIYPSNMNHLRFKKPTNQEIQKQYYFPCSITVLNQSLQTAELFYYDGEGNEFPQGRFNIPSDYLFQKALLKTDTAPTIKGLYPLSETGVYTNLGGINAPIGKLNFASFDGTTWSLIATDLPQPIVNNYTNNNTYNLDPEQIVSSEALYNDETLAGDITKRVDKITGENVNYRETTTWYDGTAMTDAKVDGFIYIKKNQKFYEITNSGELDVLFFGCQCDGVTDDRNNLQFAINYASSKKIKLTQKKGILKINSYSENPNYLEHFGAIELRSNLNFKFTEILLGEFFNDKPVLIFSGFDTLNPNNFGNVDDVEIYGGTFNLNHHNSNMGNSYKRRIAIQFAGGSNIKIHDNIFKNGDLSNCIGFSFGNKKVYVAEIYNNSFMSLAYSDNNIDHTTIYAGGDFINIHDNLFYAEWNSVMPKIGAAFEPHGSNITFENNKVIAYTRGTFITAIIAESQEIADIKIQNNSMYTTNAAVYTWLETDCIARGIICTNNIFRSKNIGDNLLYSGVQGLIFQDKGGTISDSKFDNNIFISEGHPNTSLEYIKSAVSIGHNIYNTTFNNNSFKGFDNIVYCNTNEGVNINITGEFIGNSILNASKILTVKNTVENFSMRFEANKTSLIADNLIDIFTIDGDVIISNTIIANNSYSNYQPKYEFLPNANFTTALNTNYLKTYFKVPINLEPILTNSFKFQNIKLNFDSRLIVPNKTKLSSLHLNYLNEGVIISSSAIADTSGNLNLKIENSNNFDWSGINGNVLRGFLEVKSLN